MPIHIQNAEVKRKVSSVFALGNPESAPNVSSDYTIPFVLVNDGTFGETIVRDVENDSATTATLYTTRNDKTQQFYIDSVSICADWATLDTGTEIGVRCTSGGATRKILILRRLNTATNSKSGEITFSRPIPVDNNTTIVLYADSSGTHLSSAVITGHYERI